MLSLHGFMGLMWFVQGQRGLIILRTFLCLSTLENFILQCFGSKFFFLLPLPRIRVYIYFQNQRS